MSKTSINRLAYQVDIEARKGADFHQRFHVQVQSGSTLLDYDLTQFTGASMQVRTRPNSPIAELTFSTSDGSIVLGTLGRMDLKMSAEQMDKIRAGQYDYDMYLSNATYAKRDFMAGMLTITERITR